MGPVVLPFLSPTPRKFELVLSWFKSKKSEFIPKNKKLGFYYYKNWGFANLVE
jgi:hypothetical protein